MITAVTGAVRGNFWGLRDMVQKILSRQSAANCQLRRCVDVKKHTCGDVEKHSCGYVEKHCVKISRNIVAEASRKQMWCCGDNQPYRQIDDQLHS